jgi:hypothetical protein
MPPSGHIWSVSVLRNLEAFMITMCHLGAARVSVTRLASRWVARNAGGDHAGAGGGYWVGVDVEPKALSIHPHGMSRLVRAA